MTTFPLNPQRNSEVKSVTLLRVPSHPVPYHRHPDHIPVCCYNNRKSLAYFGSFPQLAVAKVMKVITTVDDDDDDDDDIATI